MEKEKRIRTWKENENSEREQELERRARTQKESKKCKRDRSIGGILSNLQALYSLVEGDREVVENIFSFPNENSRAMLVEEVGNRDKSNFSVSEDGVLRFRSRLCVPANDELKMVKAEHQRPT
ncbi:hypothetical protein F2P56_033004 [Juglans regia]|uniref:Uncharacterized protein n=1 Tax=Juglans regia TaxID=51240 RepID=A0A833UAZ8_JUGRE|nr:hypothetical protein F2P56_033004 [Juglans regia]